MSCSMIGGSWVTDRSKSSPIALVNQVKPEDQKRILTAFADVMRSLYLA
jgi:hypothetical protein